MNTQTKYLLILVGVGIIDVFIPVPIVGLILVYVLLQRPHWFRNIVWEIYGDT